MAQPGFFDLYERYRRLSETGDPLVKLAALIDFEVFRPRLAGAAEAVRWIEGRPAAL